MNYVFRPIDRWPRKMTQKRKRSPFSVTLARTYVHLDRELGHLGVTGDVVIQIALTDRDIRQDGRPRSNANRPSHPGVMLSFTARIAGKPTPLVYVCDACLDWEDNLRAIVLTLENLRGADRYGVTAAGEQYRGWNALPPAIITPAPMTVEEAAQFIGHQLGMRNGCPIFLTDVDMYRLNYRQAAQRWHPDRHQGVQHPEWNKLQQAKDVLDRHHASMR